MSNTMTESHGKTAFEAMVSNPNSTLRWRVDHEGGRPLAAGWRTKDVWLHEDVRDEATLSYHIEGTTQVAKFEGTQCISAGIRSHSVAVTSPGTRDWKIRGTLEFAHIYLPTDWLSLIESSNGSSEQVKLTSVANAADPWLSGLFSMLTAYSETNTDGMARLLTSLRSLLTAHLHLRYTSPQGGRLPMVMRVSGGLSPMDIERVREFVADNLSVDLNIEKLAELVGYSRSHFSRAFKESLGCSPHQHLLAMRLDAARRLLRETSLPIAEIGKQVGFRTATHFSTAFSTRVGRTPGEFRRKR